jgi:hypothetical protein
VWPQARDAVAALYYVRTLALTPGETLKIPIAESGQQSTLVLQPVSVERIAVGDTAYDALRVEARIEQRVQRRQMPGITLWVEQGGARRIVAADIRAAFGNLRVRLQR